MVRQRIFIFPFIVEINLYYYKYCFFIINNLFCFFKIKLYLLFFLGIKNEVILYDII
nr:hypothetical protein [Providencia sp.]UNJ80225.1 hypothetical protein [Providencia sp.]